MPAGIRLMGQFSARDLARPLVVRRRNQDREPASHGAAECAICPYGRAKRAFGDSRESRRSINEASPVRATARFPRSAFNLRADVRQLSTNAAAKTRQNR